MSESVIRGQGSDNEAAAVWTDINSLTPWDKNPRRNDHAVAEVATSIKRFGFASPIIARTADRMVIAGHTRLKAAQSLGLDTVPVRFVDLDPADAQLLALADNKLGEVAYWDDALLADVLSGLRDEGLDLAMAGFEQAEIDSLLGAWQDPFADDAGSEIADESVRTIQVIVALGAVDTAYAAIEAALSDADIPAQVKRP